MTGDILWRGRMTSEAIASSRWLRLLPAVLMLILIGTVITVGIAQNRERVETTIARHSGGSKLDIYTESAAFHLASSQSPDGSWVAYRSVSPSLHPAEPTTIIATTMPLRNSLGP